MWAFAKIAVEIVASALVGLSLMGLIPAAFGALGLEPVSLTLLLTVFGAFLLAVILCSALVGATVTGIEAIVSGSRARRVRRRGASERLETRPAMPGWLEPIVWIVLPLVGAAAIVTGELAAGEPADILSRTTCFGAAVLGIECSEAAVAEPMRAVAAGVGFLAVLLLAFGYRRVEEKAKAERAAVPPSE